MDKSKKHIKINQKGGVTFGASMGALGSPRKWMVNKYNSIAKDVSKSGIWQGGWDALSPKNLTKEIEALDVTANPDGAPRGTTVIREPNLYEETAIWDALWNEPCWVMEGEDFALNNLGDLWTTWYNPEIITLLGLDKTISQECINKIAEAEGKEAGDNFNNADSGWSEAAETAANNRGEEVKNLLKAFALSPDGAPAAADGSVEDVATKKKKALALKSSYKHLSECSGESFSSGDVGEAGKTIGSKWLFCLFIKFLLGPAGFFILKMMPHIVTFFFTVKRTFRRIAFNYYGSGVSENGTFYKDANTRHHWSMGIVHVIITYLGTVIPFQLYSTNLGIQYGQGEFGKLIVGLTAVSAGIILMGGLGISVILICFLFYCAKVIGMFSDNVTETKKK
jgi:hypothetical protein